MSHRILVSPSGSAHIDGGCNHYPNAEYDYLSAGWGWVMNPEPGDWDLIHPAVMLHAREGNTDLSADRRCVDCERTVNRRRADGEDTYPPVPGPYVLADGMPVLRQESELPEFGSPAQWLEVAEGAAGELAQYMTTLRILDRLQAPEAVRAGVRHGARQLMEVIAQVLDGEEKP